MGPRRGVGGVHGTRRYVVALLEGGPECAIEAWQRHIVLGYAVQNAAMFLNHLAGHGSVLTKLQSLGVMAKLKDLLAESLSNPNPDYITDTRTHLESLAVRSSILMPRSLTSDRPSVERRTSTGRNF